MHMDEGVGRQGYRVLAGVIAVVGVIGLIAAVYAFRPQGDLFQWLGFGLVMAALTGLLAVTLVVLNQQANKAEAVDPDAVPFVPAAPVAAPAATTLARPVQETPAQSIPVSRMRTFGETTSLEGKPLPRPKPAVKPVAAKAATPDTPDAKQGVEFDDAEPAARAAPEELVVPPAFQADNVAGAEAAKDPKAWPERRPPSGGRIQPGDMERRAAQTLSQGTPTVMAKVWYPQSTLPRGWNKGRCGDCGTQLMAPPERPIHLRCPQCDKITTVEKPATA